MVGKLGLLNKDRIESTVKIVDEKFVLRKNPFSRMKYRTGKNHRMFQIKKNIKIYMSST